MSLGLSPQREHPSGARSKAAHCGRGRQQRHEIQAAGVQTRKARADRCPRVGNDGQGSVPELQTGYLEAPWPTVWRQEAGPAPSRAPGGWARAHHGGVHHRFSPLKAASTPWGVRTLVVSAQPAPRVPLPSRQRGGDQPSQGPQEPRKPF